jgi:hypothetical protein
MRFRFEENLKRDSAASFYGPETGWFLKVFKRRWNFEKEKKKRQMKKGRTKGQKIKRVWRNGRKEKKENEKRKRKIGKEKGNKEKNDNEKWRMKEKRMERMEEWKEWNNGRTG